MDLKMLFGEWYPLLYDSILSKAGFNKLGELIKKQRVFKEIYPKHASIFKSFTTINPSEVRVVFLGLEPYKNDKATGVAYANSSNEYNFSNSLVNLFKGIETDFLNGEKFIFDPGIDSNLGFLSSQGVFFLNAALTTDRSSKKGAHYELWKPFTSRVVKEINALPHANNIIWVLNDPLLKEYAPIIKGKVIMNEQGFDNNLGKRKLFTTINDILEAMGEEFISWAIPF